MVLVVTALVGLFDLYVIVLLYDRKKTYYDKLIAKIWNVCSYLGTAMSLVSFSMLVQGNMFHEQL